MSFITARQAADVLAPLGLSREAARRALLAGVAGSGLRVRGALLYEEARVRELASREPVRGVVPELPSHDGVLVGRVQPRTPDETNPCGWRGADLTAPPAEQTDAARMWWRVSTFTTVWLLAVIHDRGFVPFVATVGGCRRWPGTSSTSTPTTAPTGSPGGSPPRWCWIRPVTGSHPSPGGGS